MTHFSFDDWAKLARDDETSFERQREEAIAAFIESQPVARRQRLERLQWRIDRERERCATPLAACIRLSNMMWRRFDGPDGLRETLQSLRGVEAASSRRARPVRDATILAFRRRH